MKTPIFILLILFLTITLTAQAPLSFNYQSLILDQNAPYANKSIDLEITIANKRETHSGVQTGNAGIFNIVIGSQGIDLSTIDWSSGNISMDVVMTLEDGSTRNISAPLQSVPYALYAEDSKPQNLALSTTPGGDIPTRTIRIEDGNSIPLRDLNIQYLSFDEETGELLLLGGIESSSVLLDSLISVSTIHRLSKEVDGNTIKISLLDKNDEVINTISFSRGDGDSNNQNELQDLSLNGNIVEISDGEDVDLTPLIEDIIESVNLEDGDKDDRNEIQTLVKEVNGNDVTIKLEPYGGQIEFNKSDGDNNSSNELQDITKTGNELSLTNSLESVTLNDDDPKNEIQTIEIVGDELVLGPDGGSIKLDSLGDANDENELQDLMRSGDELYLSKSEFPPVVLNDDDPKNEFQDLMLNGNELTLSNSDVTVILPDSNGDADADPTNEIQTLEVNGNQLGLVDMEGNSNSIVELGDLNCQSLSVDSVERKLILDGGKFISEIPLEEITRFDSSQTQKIQLDSIPIFFEGTADTIPALTLSGSDSCYVSLRSINIQELSYNEADNSLILSNGSTFSEVDVKEFINDPIWAEDQGYAVYNMGNGIGIGSNQSNAVIHLEPDNIHFHPNGANNSSTGIVISKDQISNDALTLDINGQLLGNNRDSRFTHGLQLGSTSLQSFDSSNHGTTFYDKTVDRLALVTPVGFIVNQGSNTGIEYLAYQSDFEDLSWKQNIGEVFTYDNVGIGQNPTGNKLTVSGNSQLNGNLSISGAVLSLGDITANRIMLDEGMFRSGSLAGESIEVNADFTPSGDGGYSLGTSNKRWSEVFAVNGMINTSDRRDKEFIINTSYGLKEILQLKPVEFNWKHMNNGKRIGFIAQDLLDIIPEVVVTHEVVVDEETRREKSIPIDRFGVRYSELIPVLTRAIQEQQNVIENQGDEIDNLKKSLEK